MEKHVNIISAAFVVLVANLFGGYDKWIMALIFLSAIDYISGVVGAVYRGQKVKQLGLSSFIGFKGILRKFIMFSVVAASSIVDDLLGTGGTVRLAIIGFFISNEGISLLENAAKMDLPIPEKLVIILKALKDDGNKKLPTGLRSRLEEISEEFDERA